VSESRFLVDESVGQAVVEQLRVLGHDVEAVGELMPQALDDRVLEYAWQERRILVTNDRDFGDKVYRDGRPHAGILLLRLADDRAATKVRIITALLAAHSDQLAGRFVVVTERSIRIRPSPEA
jgi:predicted nuclease of predicted toxin-antitoxin system